jgi:hypothetical protein
MRLFIINPTSVDIILIKIILFFDRIGRCQRAGKKTSLHWSEYSVRSLGLSLNDNG